MKPLSPCIRQCCLDEEDVCLGCGRTLQEICHWQEFSEEEKHLICQESEQRLLSMRVHWQAKPKGNDD